MNPVRRKMINRMGTDYRENEMTDAAVKRSRDQFFVVLAGIVGYSLILIAIVIGTFFGVRNAFEKKDEEVARAVEQAGAAESADIEEEAAPAEMEITEGSGETGAVSDEETVYTEHDADIDKYMTGDGKLDYSNILFKPAARNTSLKWSDTVFSKIENVKEPSKAAVNTYRMQRKKAVLADDRQQEFCIYTDPETSEIEKITTVEYSDDKLDIIDYYYDKGNINYAAQRSAMIDYPVDISSGRITSRYYFKNDTMVKYSYCEDNKATVFNAASLGDYSEGTVGQYEYLEGDIINRAYITYNAAKTLNEEQHIEGYILDEYDQALADVEIKLYNDDDMTEVARTTTDGDGHYELNIAVNDERGYFLSAWKNEFDEVRIYGITAKTGSGTYFVPTPRLTYAADGAEYNEQVVVRDSLDNNEPVSEASIRLRAGLNCREGDVIASSVLDGTGAAMFTLQAGNYTAEVSKGGYENSFFNVIITMGRPATIGYAVKDLSEDKMQIILAWDITPLDLDGRLISSGGAEVLRGTVDSVGALITETIDLTKDENNSYRYYVSDYSDCTGGDANSGNMTASGARIYIYNNEGLTASYNVPTAHLGVVWEAFNIRGNTVIPVNHYYNVIEPDSYWTNK